MQKTTTPKPQVVLSESAQEIFDTVSRLRVNIFGLPLQKLAKFITVLNSPGPDLYFKLTASAVLPTLELAVSTILDEKNIPKYILKPSDDSYFVLGLNTEKQKYQI